MAGPACGVVLDLPLNGIRKAEVISVLTSLGGTPTEDPAVFNLEVVDTTSVQGSRVRGARGAIASLGTPADEYDEAELRQFEEVTGIRPAARIRLSVWEKELQDHRLLAEMALYFAEKYSGVIDFGGALMPSVPRSFSFEETPWEAIAEHWRAMVRGFPGRIWELPYNTSGGKAWVIHVADARFLRAWMASPEFHMVK